MALPRLDINQDITDEKRKPSLAFHIWWQTTVKKIETLIADLQTQVTAVNTAQSTADLAIQQFKIFTSYPQPTIVLSAADVGTTATITLDAHDRYYGDGGILAIGGTTFTNQLFSTTYYVYYDDISMANAAPSYQITTNPVTARANAVAGRHYVGKITTPADGAAATSGGGGPPPWKIGEA